MANVQQWLTIVHETNNSTNTNNDATNGGRPVTVA